MKEEIIQNGKNFKRNVKQIYLCQESNIIFITDPCWAVCKKRVQRLGIEVLVLMGGKTSSTADCFISVGS
jgi:hypothetical protein